MNKSRAGTCGVSAAKQCEAMNVGSVVDFWVWGVVSKGAVECVLHRFPEVVELGSVLQV